MAPALHSKLKMKYTSKKTRAKAPAKRRQRRPQKKRQRIPRGPSVLANIPRVTRHRYVQMLNLDPTAGSKATFYLSCNNINRPDFQNAIGTAGSHQPMMVDQMAVFYKNFTVIGSKITVTTVGIDTTVSNLPFVWGVTVSPDTVTVNEYKTMLENGIGYGKLVNGYSGADRQTMVRKTFSTKKYFSLQSVKDNFDRVGAIYDNTGIAAPYQQAWFAVWAQALNSSADATLQQYLATVDYIVLWSEPNLVAAS